MFAYAGLIEATTAPVVGDTVSDPSALLTEFASVVQLAAPEVSDVSACPTAAATEAGNVSVYDATPEGTVSARVPVELPVRPSVGTFCCAVKVFVFARLRDATTEPVEGDTVSDPSVLPTEFATEAQLRVPVPSVTSAAFDEPADVGNVSVTSAASAELALRATPAVFAELYNASWLPDSKFNGTFTMFIL